VIQKISLNKNQRKKIPQKRVMRRSLNKQKKKKLPQKKKKIQVLRKKNRKIRKNLQTPHKKKMRARLHKRNHKVKVAAVGNQNKVKDQKLLLEFQGLELKQEFLCLE